jgi:transposase
VGVNRKAYPSDVGDDEWAFVAPYLTLMKQGAPQRGHPLREVFNGLRWIVRSGAEWRMMPNDLPPWHTVYQQTRRWLRAGVFEAIAHDLRMLLREDEGRPPRPRAASGDSRAPQSSPASGERAGHEGRKQRTGSEVHPAGDTLGQLLARLVTPADARDREQVAELAERVREAAGAAVEVAFVGPGYTGEQPAAEAAGRVLRLDVVKLPTATRGFVLLPRRWVVERSPPWMARFRRLARDYERLPQTLADARRIAVPRLRDPAGSTLHRHGPTGTTGPSE